MLVIKDALPVEKIYSLYTSHGCIYIVRWEWLCCVSK